MDEIADRSFRRNAVLFVIDSMGFVAGLAVLGPTTILPTLVRQLGGGPEVVGLLSAIQMGGYTLPQLIAGRYLANRARVKGQVVLLATLSRLVLLLMVPALLFWALSAPALALWALVVAFGGFCLIDSLSVVGWFDLMGKAVPQAKRGRVMGAGQSLASLSGIGAGLLVRDLLGRQQAFPSSYILIILLAWGILALCPVALALVQERPSALACTERPSWSQYIPRLSTILRQDRRFAWLATTMCLAGFADMGAVFYVLYAHEHLGLPQQAIGLFISAQVVGGLLSGVALGPLGDRSGARAVIHTVMTMRFLAPLLVLATPLLAGLSPALATGSFMVVFVLTGVVGGSYMTGSMNYLLEIAPETERPTYVGLVNTLSGLTLVAPLLAGWLVAALSYEAVFGLAGLVAAAGLLLAFWVPRSRQVAHI
ncbi:MAG: MFS transporter [Anaerolineae bacterium]